MSTFGKKSLVWWDYHSHDKESTMRFNRTPKDLQLKILEKWYPIGMMVGIGDGKYQHRVENYLEHFGFWNVQISWKVDGLMNNLTSDRNPLSLYPSPEFEKQLKRQYKLDRVFKSENTE